MAEKPASTNLDWTRLRANQPLSPSQRDELEKHRAASGSFEQLSTKATSTGVDTAARVFIKTDKVSGWEIVHTRGNFKKSVPSKAQAGSAQKPEVMDMTREEIDAKLQASEARLDAKVAQIDGKIDRLADLIGSLRSDIERQNHYSAEQAANVKDQMRELKEDNKSTRSTIALTVISSAIGVIAIVATIQFGLLSAFSSGLAARMESPTSAVNSGATSSNAPGVVAPAEQTGSPVSTVDTVSPSPAVKESAPDAN